MMFCPKCRSEYRDGVDRCPDCGADLVAEPGEDRHPDASLVPLLSTYNPGDIAMIRSILDGSSIRYHIQAEHTVHIRPYAQPAVLLVASGDVEEAKELLKDLDLRFMTVSWHAHDPERDR